MLRKILSFLSLALLLCFSLALAEGYQLGDTMPDFTVTTYDGRTITLSEVLQKKDAVLINLWATWCPPCRAEFPHMQEAYERYSGDIEIIALSSEPGDTDEVLADFVAQQGLTFPVGRDTAYLSYQFATGSIPTSVVVDRFGTICYIAAGAMPDVDSFARLFDAFVGESYDRSVILRSLPAGRPDATPSTQEELAAALDTADFAFRADDYVYAWPMIVSEKDGRSVAASTNAGQTGSQAVLHADFTANAGDAVAVTFKASTYPVADLLQLSLDGDVVKSFGGEEDWQTYAIAIPAQGQHTLTLTYDKLSNAPGEDAVWIDSIALLTGDAAQAALAQNPAYPVASAVALHVTTPGAREIVFDDPTGIMVNSFGAARYYIIPGGTAEFLAILDASIDPEAAYAYANFDGSVHPMDAAMTADGYVLTSGMDTLDTTGYAFSGLYLYPSAMGDAVAGAVFFADEAAATSLVTTYFPEGGWAYAEEPAEEPVQAIPTAKDGPVTYGVRVVDDAGQPIPGAMVQLCDDHTCQVMITSADGTASLEMEPGIYELHLLKAPDGYLWDKNVVVTLGFEGGVAEFGVEK